MHVEIFRNGKLIYDIPDILSLKQRLKEEKETFWAAVLRLKNPYEYHVDLSDKLWTLKKGLLDK
jgi:nicotinate phosphoribosyltransferase